MFAPRWRCLRQPIPAGLNLYTGWKVKFFGEYYQQPDEEQGDMQVLA